MNRRKLRYWLFRFKTEIEGGSPALDSPAGLKEEYESQQIFPFCGGWKTFGIKWDVTEKEPFEIVAIEESLWLAWDKHCASVAKEFPKQEKERIKIKREAFSDNEEVEVDLHFD